MPTVRLVGAVLLLVAGVAWLRLHLRWALRPPFNPDWAAERAAYGGAALAGAALAFLPVASPLRGLFLAVALVALLLGLLLLWTAR